MSDRIARGLLRIRLGELLVSLSMLGGAALIVSGTYFSGRATIGPSAPAVFPTAVAALLVAFSLCNVYAAVKNSGTGSEITAHVPWQSWAAIFGAVVYAALLYLVGYFAATVLAIPAFAVLAGERRLISLIVSTAILLGGIAYGFGYVLRVPLPEGLLWG